MRKGARLSGAEFETALQKLEELWRLLYIHAVSDSLIRDASVVAKEHALRAYDALHLASLMAFAERPLTLACWDNELRSAARERGIPLMPRESLTGA
jgi:predicted nucleic acid-binding protein